MPPYRRPEDLATGVEAPVPYDQTGLSGDPNEPAAAGPPQGLGDVGQSPQQAPMDLGGLVGQDPSQPQAVQGDGSGQQDPGLQPAPEDIQVEQMAAALQDPNTSPQEKQVIQQQLALAARRQLAGLGQ